MILRLHEVRKTYRLGKVQSVHALRGMDLDVDAGEFVAIVGPSGSGKTTLLNLSGLLDHPDSGEIWIDGTATAALNEPQRASIRRSRIGFVFQTFNLLPHLTAEENVALPLRYGDGVPPRSPAELLARFGLGERLAHKPDELSGGEQQRVAIARALVLDPPLILADEPTGDLDSETAAGILAVLRELHDEGKTLIVVTHNQELADAAARRLHMRDGHVVDDTRRAAEPTRSRERSPAAKKGTQGAPRSGAGQSARRAAENPKAGSKRTASKRSVRSTHASEKKASGRTTGGSGSRSAPRPR